MVRNITLYVAAQWTLENPLIRHTHAGACFHAIQQRESGDIESLSLESVNVPNSVVGYFGHKNLGVRRSESRNNLCVEKIPTIVGTVTRKLP